jgi:nucleoside-diphosphate-sugar epimerase
MPLTLVTGATGFIGGHLARRLRAAGNGPVRLLVRDAARVPADLAAGTEIVAGDLNDPVSIMTAVRGADCIFHCAANVATWDTPGRYRVANVDGVATLLAAIRAQCPQPVRYVHLSTMDVYGFPAAPCDEDAPLPQSGFGYGDSKREGEALVRAAAREWGLRQTILRPGNVIGPGSHFIEGIGRQLRGGVMLTIDGGRAHAGLTPVDLVVDAMLWAADAPVALGRCYNLRGPEDLDWAYFVSELRAGIGGRGRVVNLPFAVAQALAVAAETLHRGVRARREPLLHRLLVRMFGRTCGHSPARFFADRGNAAIPATATAMRQSIAWFRATHRLDG